MRGTKLALIASVACLAAISLRRSLATPSLPASLEGRWREVDSGSI